VLKVHYQTDQEVLFAACGGMMSTLIDTERGVKCAASDAIGRDVIEAMRPDKDHFLQHVVAMGDHELYGPNRNADAWTKEANSTCYPTFVKYGHYFREHRHSNPALAIGSIKHAAYNDRMARIELLVWGHKKKAAEEYAAARAGKPLSYSMAAKVPFDVCSCCHNKARSPAEWCGHMKKSRGQYLPEFNKYAFVFNPNPKYFDISRVGYPADRIAHYLSYAFGEEEGMAKAASGDIVVSGAEWAAFEGLREPDGIDRACLAPALSAYLKKMAAAERQVTAGCPECTREMAELAKAAAYLMDLSRAPSSMGRPLRKPETGTVMRKLACGRTVLPLPLFASMLSGKDVGECMRDSGVAGAEALLPGIFSRMEEQGVSEDMTGLFTAYGHFAAENDPKYDDEVDRVVAQAENLFGLDGAVKRCSAGLLSSALREPAPRRAAEDLGAAPGGAVKLAESYAQYQLRALLDMELSGNAPSGMDLALLAGCNSAKRATLC
jgi:hypothetical protein